MRVFRLSTHQPKTNAGPDVARFEGLSDHTVKNKGTRGWKPVIVDGEPVKLGNMVLAEMPEGKARARNAHYAALGNERLKQNTERFMETGGGTAVSDQ